LGLVSVDGVEVREELTPAKLLFAVAECFRCRTLQYWGVKVSLPPAKAIASAPSTSSSNHYIPGSLGQAGSGSALFLLQQGQSRSPRMHHSVSSGDLGLDLDGSLSLTPPPLGIELGGDATPPPLGEELDQASDAMGGSGSGPGSRSPSGGLGGLGLTSPSSLNNLSGVEEQRRRNGGDVMYDKDEAEKAVDGNAGGIDKDTDQPVEGAVAYSKATEVIDPLAYYVPCPASSGGFFAPSGALMTFGGARFQIRVLAKGAADGSDPLCVDTDAGGDAHAGGNGYAQEEHAIAEGNNGNGNNFAQNLYPKSYADMLLRQREREFYESEKTAEDQILREKASGAGAGAGRGAAATPGGSRKTHPAGGSPPPNARPIVKSSSGVFFVDHNSSSDSETEGESSESDSHSSSSSDDSSTSGAESEDVDIDQDNDTSFLSNSVYVNPLFNADMDMEALSAHLDEEQVYLKRNISSGSRTTLYEEVGMNSQHDEAKKKRFLVAEELQVSSQNPTRVEIYSRGFEVPQTLADEYDLGPTSTKLDSLVRGSDSAVQKGAAHTHPHPHTKTANTKTANALFAHMRAEPEGGNTRFLLKAAGVGANLVGKDGSLSMVRSPARGISPMSRAHPPRGTDSDAIITRLRSSSSYNDSLLTYDEMNKNTDKDEHGSMPFPSIKEADADAAEEFDALPFGLSESYQGDRDSFKRGVTWGRAQGGYEQGASDDVLPPEEGGEAELAAGSPLAPQGAGHRRVPSNSLRQLPFSMADLDIYSDTHKEDEVYDDYRADDFSFHRGSAAGDSNQGPLRRNSTEAAGEEQAAAEAAPDLSEARFIEPIIRDYRLSKIVLRVESCKDNAEIAAARGNVDASQLWHLLSISLGTMAISVPLDPDENIPSHISSGRGRGRGKGVSRVLLSRGPQTSWRDSAIGLLLLKRVLSLCEQTGGVQTLATMICVLGGPSHAAVLLAADHPFFSSCSLKSIGARIEPTPEVRRIEVHYNGVLNAYCNVLHCWGRFITCTEVKRYIYNIYYIFHNIHMIYDICCIN
jgi:hypothetical protein